MTYSFVFIFKKVGLSLFSAGNAPTLRNVPVAKRILICAPSNQVVDDLAWKLHNKAIGIDGRPGSFNIIRFGMRPGKERVSITFFNLHDICRIR